MPGQPAQGDVYVSRPLQNVSVAYLQGADRFIANRLFPVVNVQIQGGKYFLYDKHDWMRSEAKLRAPASESEGSGWRLTQDNYFANVFAVHKDLDRETRANAQAPINLEREASQWVTHQLYLKRDIDWAADFFKASVWGTDVTGVAATPTGPQVLHWSDAASDPMVDVHLWTTYMTEITAKLSSEMSLVVGMDVWNALRSNPAILERIKYTQGPAIPSAAVIAQLFGIKEIVVSAAVNSTAAEGTGTDADMSFIYSKKDALLLYTPNSPSLMEPSAGYTFTWNGLLGQGAFGPRVRRFDIPLKNSIRVEGELAYDMKVVSADAGVFFDGVVA